MAEQHQCIECRVECTCDSDPCVLCVDCWPDDIKERAAIQCEHLPGPFATEEYHRLIYDNNSHT